MSAGAAASLLLDIEEATDEELVARYQAGDQRAVEALLIRYRQFTHMKSRSYFLPGGTPDDVVQEGMIGLYKAIRDYTPGRRASFRTFADICITRQIVSAIKAATRHKHEPLNSGISLSKPISVEEDPDRTLSDALPATELTDPADLLVRREEMAGIRRAFGEVLSEFEAEVLLLYIEGKSYRKIAGDLHSGLKAVDNALQRVKRKLEQSLRDDTDDPQDVPVIGRRAS